MKFSYYLELKKGYRPTSELTEVNEVEIVIEAKNRATADRIGKVIFDNPNIINWNGVCIDD